MQTQDERRAKKAAYMRGRKAKNAAYMREYRKDPVVAAKHRARTRRYAERMKAEGTEPRLERRARLAAVKLAAGCTDCGYREHPEALHFDHLPGTDKLFNISQLVTRSWASIEAEIEKCEVVCANCHAVRTANRRLTPKEPTC